MSSQSSAVRHPSHIPLAISLVLFGLMFVWSVTGTTALRNVLLFLSLAITPLAGIDWPSFKRCLMHSSVLLLLALTGWIVFQNQFLAWDTSRAWHESVQWFKSITCLGLGAALGCAPRQLTAPLRWQRWIAPIALAWALHLVLNMALKDWGSLTFVAALQSGTPIGTRDMVSYLGTGLLALLLADLVARSAGRTRILPTTTRWLWVGVFAAVALTAATMTRNSILVIALELGMAMAALIGRSASKRQRSRRGLLTAAVLVLVSATLVVNIKFDQRWQNFSDSARIAWDIEHNKWWIDQTKNPQPMNTQGVLVDHSAYNRIAWIRGASYLISEYPLGTGYDRNAFRRALMKHYGTANTASGHAHAGLLDFTLATGLPGGLLLVVALLVSIGYGWGRWRTTRDAAGLALAIFVASYLLRAAVDGIVRDHMLEQAMFVIGLLLAATVSEQSKADV